MEGESTAIGREKTANAALTTDVDSFAAELLSGLEDIPAHYAHMGPANAAGPAPVDLTPRPSRTPTRSPPSSTPPAGTRWPSTAGSTPPA